MLQLTSPPEQKPLRCPFPELSPTLDSAGSTSLMRPTPFIQHSPNKTRYSARSLVPCSLAVARWMGLPPSLFLLLCSHSPGSPGGGGTCWEGGAGSHAPRPEAARACAVRSYLAALRGQQEVTAYSRSQLFLLSFSSSLVRGLSLASFSPPPSVLRGQLGVEAEEHSEPQSASGLQRTAPAVSQLLGWAAAPLLALGRFLSGTLCLSIQSGPFRAPVKFVHVVNLIYQIQRLPFGGC